MLRRNRYCHDKKILYCEYQKYIWSSWCRIIIPKWVSHMIIISILLIRRRDFASSKLMLQNSSLILGSFSLPHFWHCMRFLSLQTQYLPWNTTRWCRYCRSESYSNLICRVVRNAMTHTVEFWDILSSTACCYDKCVSNSINVDACALRCLKIVLRTRCTVWCTDRLVWLLVG